MTVEEAQLIFATVEYYDLSTGPLNPPLTTYNFITDGGYSPSGDVGVPCNIDANGSLLLSFSVQGPYGNPPILNVLDGPNTGLTPATNVPLNVYAADGFRPWLQYTMEKAGTYTGKTLFRRTGWPDTIIDTWEETWN